MFVVGYCVNDRDREPSRIPVKKISRIQHKTRTIRCLLKCYIRKEVPRSSQMHTYVKASSNNIHCGTKIAKWKSKLI